MSQVPPSAAYVAAGASHRTSTARLRGRILIEDALLPRFLAGLKESSEAVVLSSPERIGSDPVKASSVPPGVSSISISRSMQTNA